MYNLCVYHRSYKVCSNHGANKAVDGDINTFSITENEDFYPWWKVNLAYPVWVTRVEIINEKEPSGYIQL